MAISQKLKVINTAGDVWQDAVPGPANITALTMANRVIGSVSVSVRIQKQGASSQNGFIVPNDELVEGGSARLRLPALVLEAGDTLQVKSSGGVDWSISYVVIS